MHIAYQAMTQDQPRQNASLQMICRWVEKRISNKNSNISYFLLLSMNSERFNERLHQIKEKYGRANHKNPEEKHTQRSYKIETTPLHSQTPNYKHVNCQEMTGKAMRKELRLENQPQYRRQKQNYPTTPLSLLKNQSPIGRCYPENQSQRLQGTIMHRSEFIQNQRPSMSDNYTMQDISPRRNEQNSPIRKLPYQFDNQTTPRQATRQYRNITERPPPLTTPKNNITLNAYTPHNLPTTPLSKTNQISSWRPNQRDSRIPESPAGIPKASETASTLPRKGQQFHQQGQMSNFNGQKGSKSVFSIKSITSIQERIQMAINTNKK